MIARLLFWFRAHRLRNEMEVALAIRRRGRAERQAAARKAAETRFHQRMEGLKR